jgi:hypothetical protein
MRVMGFRGVVECGSSENWLSAVLLLGFFFQQQIHAERIHMERTAKYWSFK